MSLVDQFSRNQKVILNSQLGDEVQAHGEPAVVIAVGEQKVRVELVETTDSRHDSGWVGPEALTPIQQ